MSLRFNSELLISAVQARPILWQDDHKDYKNKTITNGIWEEVGQLCVPLSTGAVAKQKWKNLKDSYRKKLQKLPASRITSDAKTLNIKWPYFDIMSFIQPYIFQNTKDGILPEISLNSDNSKDEINNLIFDDTSLASSSSESIRENNKKKKNNSKITKNKRRTDVAERIIALEEKRLKLVKEEMQKNEENSDLQYFKSLLPYMQLFTEIEKLQIRGQIQQLIVNKLREKQRMKTTKKNNKIDDNIFS